VKSRDKNPLDEFPPGFAAKRYRATPEQIEQNIRESQIQRERDEQAWRRSIEKEKERSQTKPDEKPEGL